MRIIKPSFDKKGQVNAFSYDEAQKRIAKYLTAEQKEVPSFEDQKVSEKFSSQEQDYLIERFASDNARHVIGQAMASPIKTFLEYSAVMRNALTVDPLAPGALPVYDRDTEEISATVIASQASGQQTRITSKRFEVPMFEIMSFPTVKLREVKIRRFNMIDRIQVRTRQFMQEAEDAAIINLLDSSATFENEAVTEDIAATGYITRRSLVKVARQIVRHDLFAKSYFFSIYRYTDLEQWGRDEVDLVTWRQIIDTGLVAQLHGKNIYVTKKMPWNKVLCTSSKSYVGVMPVLQDIEVIPADVPNQTMFGWVFTELVGMAIFNPKGIARLDITE